MAVDFAFETPQGGGGEQWLTILANEALWVGVPCLLLVGAARVVHALRGVRGS